MSAVGYAGGGLASPRSLAIGLQRNRFFVVDSAGDCVRGYDVSTGKFLGDIWCGTDASNRDKGKIPYRPCPDARLQACRLAFAPSFLLHFLCVILTLISAL